MKKNKSQSKRYMTMRSKSKNLKEISRKRGRRWSRSNNRKRLRRHSRMLTSWWLRVTMNINKKEFRMRCVRWQILEEQACVSHLKMKSKDIKTLHLIVMSTKLTIRITRVSTIKRCTISKHPWSKKQVYHKNLMASK